jgi:hypothetical protein
MQQNNLEKVYICTNPQCNNTKIFTEIEEY